MMQIGCIGRCRNLPIGLSPWPSHKKHWAPKALGASEGGADAALPTLRHASARAPEPSMVLDEMEKKKRLSGSIFNQPTEPKRLADTAVGVMMMVMV